jgi:hypothetical protein
MNTATCAASLDKRNQQLQDTFYQRYTQVPRAQKPNRALVVEQLAKGCCISAKTAEIMLYT